MAVFTGALPQMSHACRHEVVSGIHLLSAEEPVHGSSAETELSRFEVFFRQTYPAIVATAFRIVGNAQEAEEIASEAFTRLYRENDEIRNGVGWLKRTAVRLALDCLRASRRRKRREDDGLLPPAVVPCPESSFRENEQRFQVRQVLSELPKRDAEILLARAEGFSYTEIAEAFGLSPASVGKALLRAEANFRRRYENYYGKN